MFDSQRKDKNKNLLPFWHYEGMTGIAWFSSDHKEVAFERFRRICETNNVGEKAMRYCHNCEAGIGIMRRSAYEYICTHPYIHMCRACGKPVYSIPPEK